MRPPTLPWVGYTLFRLICVVFMAWTLVVQFIALSNDLKEYSRIKATRRLTDASESPLGFVLTSATSTFIPVASVVAIGSVKDFNEGLTGLNDAPEPIGVIGYDDHQRGTQQMARMVRRGDPASESKSFQAVYYGDSGIPDQPGGAFFVTVLRLVVAILLLILILGQLGLPEDLMYRYGGLLGPQSTPLTLGALQTVLALQTLSMHAAKSLLIPSFTLLGLGLVNGFIGIALLFVARRLPSRPPAPLYFSKVYRLLYWTQPPSFYRQLNPKDPSHPSYRNPGQTHENCGSTEHNDVEKQEQPRSNALEVGLAESDEEDDDWVELNTAQNAIRTRPTIPEHRHTDVRKGGYPTFSGHALNTPGRNAPAGELEVSTGKVAFVSEDSKKLRDQHDMRMKIPNFITASRSTKAQQQRSKLAPLDISTPSKSRTASLRLPPKRSNTRDTTAQVHMHVQKRSHDSSVPNLEAGSSLTPIGEEASSATTIKSNLRSSIQAAATELGPRFPLPPSRSQTADSTIPPDSVDKSISSQSRKSRRKSSADSLHKPAPLTAQARNPALTSIKPVPTSPIRLMPKTSRSVNTEPPESPQKLPRLAQVEASQSTPGLFDTNIPRSPQGTPPSSPSVRLGKQVTVLRPSLAPDTRSPSAVTAHTERVAQGVRFQLDSPNTKTPSTGTLTASIITPGVASPKSGLRIPGTSFILPLPFVMPGSPRPTRQLSVDSTDSDLSAARPESTANTTSFASQELQRPELVARESSGDIDIVGPSARRDAEDRAGLPRRRESGAVDRAHTSRPKSFAVLGGSYLDGHPEQNTQRRRFSSVDSSR